ncbi:MAG: hypothetical protein FD187_702 [bacterium]|nr:MAG: hypothetical protein FD142_959 [bacterium]KAF0150112.1 MAG: hypothetical protein FD187_702 [bacterium]KAF0169220.1 MAG: hypothetical protein FD158_772 [bacterium]TXT16708.1 MAG: hypothetical protein FD132_2725 [bacterium]
MHPASRILTYLIAALATPGLPFFVVALLTLAALPLLAILRRTPVRLMWRARWLLLVLVLGYAYGLPGEPLLPALGDYSPSHAGLLHGSQQALRLLLLLLWLDILVLAQPSDRLLEGLYRLAAPFSALGVDSRRAALRLGLTLQAIERLERGRGNLARLLDTDAGNDLPGSFSIRMHPLRPLDLLAPMGLLGALLALWLNA